MTIGAVMHQLVAIGVAIGNSQVGYQLVYHVFHEHFLVITEAVQLIPVQQISGATLRSPDDPEVTFRTKQGEAYWSYVVNVTKTGDPDNAFQLVVKTQTEANIIYDCRHAGCGTARVNRPYRRVYALHEWWLQRPRR